MYIYIDAHTHTYVYIYIHLYTYIERHMYIYRVDSLEKGTSYRDVYLYLPTYLDLDLEGLRPHQKGTPRWTCR